MSPITAAPEKIAAHGACWVIEQSSAVTSHHHFLAAPVYTEADDYCVAGNTLTLRQRRGDDFLTTILTK